MLKFFRRYNKLILVIGASLLMVAFLIQPVLDIFFPDPRERPVALIAGEEITLADRRAADIELRILAGLGLDFRVPPAIRAGLEAQGVRFPLPQNEDVWMMLVAEAEGLELAAGADAVAAVYQQVGATSELLERMADQLQVTQGFVDQAVRKWLMVQDYLELSQGGIYQSQHASQSPLVGMRSLTHTAGSLTQLYEQTRDNPMLRSNPLLALMYGLVRLPGGSEAQRLSSPLIQQMTQRLGAQLDVEYVVLPAEVVLADIEPPSQQQVLEVFEKFKDRPAGPQSEPYGFGYQQPMRVKLEYFTVPIERVRAKVTQEITQAEVEQAYRQQPGRFEAVVEQSRARAATQPASTQAAGAATRPASGPIPALPREAREEIADILIDELAQSRARQIITAAQAILAEDVRRSPRMLDGDRDVSKLQPTPLIQVAREIEERFGVEPEINDLTRNFVPLNEVGEIPGLGVASTDDQQQMGVQTYLSSMREFSDGENIVPVTRRPQLKLASKTLQDMGGSFHLLRVTEAQPPQPPASFEALDERDQERVREDARRLAAYEQLLANKEQWKTIALEQGMTAVVEKAGPAAVLERAAGITPVDPRAGRGAPPILPALERQREVVDALFDRALTLGQDALESDTPDAGYLPLGVPNQLSLVVFKLNAFRPVTQEAYERELGSPGKVIDVNARIGLSHGADAYDLETLKQRTGFKDLDGPAEPDQTDEAE